jgi:hypothetical protein
VSETLSLRGVFDEAISSSVFLAANQKAAGCFHPTAILHHK